MLVAIGVRWMLNTVAENARINATISSKVDELAKIIQSIKDEEQKIKERKEKEQQQVQIQMPVPRYNFKKADSCKKMENSIIPKEENVKFASSDNFNKFRFNMENFAEVMYENKAIIAGGFALACCMDYMENEQTFKNNLSPDSDIDIWCSDDIAGCVNNLRSFLVSMGYNKLRTFVNKSFVDRRMYLHDLLNGTRRNNASKTSSYYPNKHIKSVETYLNNDKIVQLIITDFEPGNYEQVIGTFDLNICRVALIPKENKLFQIEVSDIGMDYIKERKFYVSNKMCEKSEFTKRRIQKYIARGFRYIDW